MRATLKQAHGRPALLELVGPAGAGKSMVLQSLAARVAVRPASVWSIPKAVLLVSAVRLLPTLLRFCGQAQSFPWDDVKHLIRLKALYQLLTHRAAGSHELVVLDEGPVFALSWLHVFGHPAIHNGVLAAWWRRTLHEWAAAIDAVILLDAPDPVLARRIRQRDKALSVRDKSDPEIFAFSASFRAAFGRVIAALASEGGPIVLTFGTGAASPEQVAERLLTALWESPHGR